MAQSLVDLLQEALPLLRYAPTPKRVRASLDGHPVADSTRTVLVWEPRRLVPAYAVPREDITADLTDAEPVPDADTAPVTGGAPAQLLYPSVTFAVHTAPGRPLTVTAAGVEAVGAAFALEDPDLAGYVLFDVTSFSWREEDEEVVGHPRDPMHRIDVRPSSRRIRIEHEGTVLAETDSSMVLFEGTFSTPRYYLPRHAVLLPLTPGLGHSTCSYKGHATYWSIETGGLSLPDIAWSYEQPLHDAEPVRGMLCFYTERLDLFVDGRPVDPQPTP